MDMDAQAVLLELRTLKPKPASALPRLHELKDAVEQAMLPKRHSQASLAAALTVQAIEYLCEGIQGQQNIPEINRRFAVAIQRAESWVARLNREAGEAGSVV